MNKTVEILLVDDDEMTLFIHEKILGHCSIPLAHRSFRSGEACIEYIREQTRGEYGFVLLLDINMPGMSGWDVLNSIIAQNLQEHGVVIMATSSVDFDDRKRAEKYSCVIDFFEKPLTLDACEKIAGMPEVIAIQQKSQ